MTKNSIYKINAIQIESKDENYNVTLKTFIPNDDIAVALKNDSILTKSIRVKKTDYYDKVPTNISIQENIIGRLEVINYNSLVIVTEENDDSSIIDEYYTIPTKLISDINKIY